MKVKLLARVVKDGETVGGFTRDVELPFVPTIGMQFRQGTSTSLWENEEDREIYPRITNVIYDFDEECIVALFKISESLVSTFWIPLQWERLNGQCWESKYFEYAK